QGDVTCAAYRVSITMPFDWPPYCVLSPKSKARRPWAGRGSLPRAEAKGMAGLIRPGFPGMRVPPDGASSTTACFGAGGGVNMATLAGGAAAVAAAASVAAATGATVAVFFVISTGAVEGVSDGGLMI